MEQWGRTELRWPKESLSTEHRLLPRYSNFPQWACVTDLPGNKSFTNPWPHRVVTESWSESVGLCGRSESWLTPLQWWPCPGCHDAYCVLSLNLCGSMGLRARCRARAGTGWEHRWPYYSVLVEVHPSPQSCHSVLASFFLFPKTMGFNWER